MSTKADVKVTPWEKLTPDEKLERRLAAWLSTENREFDSPEAEAAYKARVTRYIDAIQLKKTPDRVPVSPTMAGFAARYAGFTAKEMMTEPEKAVQAAIKCTLDFDPDSAGMAGGPSAKALELLDYKLYSWPGHGVDDDSGVQFNEGEYMSPEEYDDLIIDPSDFWQRKYIPRIIGALAPFTKLQPFVEVIEIPGAPSLASSYADQEIEAAFQKLFEAGREVRKWNQVASQAARKLERLGYPGGMGGSSRAPFDAIGDVMRGTRGIMIDMLKRPDKLLEALDRLVPLMIRMGVNSARMGAAPIIMIPLHKGADGWMSDQQFKTFYWPSLKKVMLGLVEEGLMVRPFAEGGYNTRLEIIRDMPKGRIIWYFDYTDMAKAKDVLGDVACIQGNVPAALIHTGTPEEVTAYCRKLIDTAGKGGGYILTTGAGIDASAKPENVHALIRSAKEYGIYS